MSTLARQGDDDDTDAWMRWGSFRRAKPESMPG